MTIALAAAAIVVVRPPLLSLRVLREYERAVVFRLGRLLPVKGPGLVALRPGVDRMVRVDLRTITMTIPPQELITRDNVPARVAAVCYFRVVDPAAAVTAIEAFAPATSQIAQTTLRSVLGGADLDQLLAERERLNEDLQKIIDEQTEPWGIKVSTVEIKDVEIPEAMQRAMARQAEAERERRAKIIKAEGEFQAAEKLADAAAILGREPSALQLRYLQTLVEIGADQSTTIVFPLPLDVLAPFVAGHADAPAAVERAAPHGTRERLTVDEWTVIRFLHVVALAFFVGGQLLLAIAVVPALRGRDEDAAMRAVARRFGIASAAALVVLIVTGAAMAGHLSRWSDPTLQAKLALLVLIGVLLALHVLTPYTRAVSLSVLATSILIVWLGIRLTHG